MCLGSFFVSSPVWGIDVDLVRHARFRGVTLPMPVVGLQLADVSVAHTLQLLRDLFLGHPVGAGRVGERGAGGEAEKQRGGERQDLHGG